MRLLVSVRDAEEARAALEGGAEIVDAKEPRLGALAPVSPDTLESICDAVPVTVPLSVALGNADADALGDLVGAVAPLRRREGLYLKAAVTSRTPEEAGRGIATACRVLKGRADGACLIVARYVDQPSDADALSRWISVIAATGARGLLLDTSQKLGPDLLASVAPRALAALRRQATREGVWLAVAGRMTVAHIPQLQTVRPHVLGVRGAVCDGGRAGTLSAGRVAEFRQAACGVSARARRRESMV